MSFTFLDPILLLGLTIAIVRLVKQLKFDINPRMYNGVMTKIFEAGEFDKAAKITRAIPDACYARMIAAAAEASAAKGSETVIRSATVEAFTLKRVEELERLAQGFWLDGLALASVLGPLLYAGLAGVPLWWIHGLVSVAAILALAFSARARARIRNADAEQAL